MSLTNEKEIKRKFNVEDKQVKPFPMNEAPRRVSIKPDECKALCEATGLDYHTGYEDRVIERITTTEATDRDGDIVRYLGIDNSHFRNEPVVLFAHDRGSLPVGRSIKEWKDKTILGWRSWDIFADNDSDTTGRSDVVFRMVVNGWMRGGSIGFVSREHKGDYSDEERREIGLGKYGVEFKKVLKLEHSACSVPSNQEALANNIKSLDKKLINGTLEKSDLDLLEKHCMLDNDIIDLLYDTLGVKRIVSVPKMDDGESIFNDYIQKPYPNEHAARVRDPDDFEQDSFKRKKVTNGVNIIIGKLKGETTMTTQAYRFDKNKFSPADAKKWLKENNIKYISFEPASDKTSENNENNIDKNTNIILNLDMKGINDEVDELLNRMKAIEEKADTIVKSMTEKVESLIAIANKAISAIERTNDKKSLYDGKSIEQIFKL